MIEKFRLAKWQNGKMGKLFQTKEHGANIKPKEMLNYLEGGVRGEFVKRLQNTIGNTNEYKRIQTYRIFLLAL